MIRRILVAAALLAAVPATAQPADERPISGTRLDVVANGEVTRVPDIVHINAGVVTQAASATEAIRQNAATDGGGASGAAPGRHRRPGHPDQQHQPQPQLPLRRKPAASR